MFRYQCLALSLAGLLSVSVPVQAQEMGPDAQLQFFATCAGRLAAVVEQEWTERGAVSDTVAYQQHQVGEIVAAIAPRDRSRDILTWRNHARDAQQALLNRARAAHNQDDAAWANRRAQELHRECTSVLLG